MVAQEPEPGRVLLIGEQWADRVAIITVGGEIDMKTVDQLRDGHDGAQIRQGRRRYRDWPRQTVRKQFLNALTRHYPVWLGFRYVVPAGIVCDVGNAAPDPGSPGLPPGGELSEQPRRSRHRDQ